MPADRHPLDAPDAPDAVGPYRHAVRSGGLLFLSGQIPLDPATGELVPGGPGVQAERCLENLDVVCRAAGTTLVEGAVRIGIFCTDLAAFPEINAACERRFGVDPPARATVEVSGLPRGAHVEIEAVVAVDG